MWGGGRPCLTIFTNHCNPKPATFRDPRWIDATQPACQPPVKCRSLHKHRQWPALTSSPLRLSVHPSVPLSVDLNSVTVICLCLLSGAAEHIAQLSFNKHALSLQLHHSCTHTQTRTNADAAEPGSKVNQVFSSAAPPCAICPPAF